MKRNSVATIILFAMVSFAASSAEAVPGIYLGRICEG